MQRLDMTDYVPTEIKVPRVGWDDPNAVETICPKCKGLIGVPGRIYGLVANWCMCGYGSVDTYPSTMITFPDEWIKKLVEEKV